MDRSIELALQEGLDTMGLKCPAQPFLAYLQLLHKWNRAYNLTAVRDLPAMVSRHVLDSLAILPWVKGPRCLDVGSGAGLPGLILAIARPDLDVVLLDSNGKKTRFLQEAKRVLKLKNVQVVQSRVESYHPRCPFDTVISRAFSELSAFVQWTEHLIASSGHWLAMKGRYPEKELSDTPKAYQVKTYAVPGLEGERCCVIIAR